MPLSSPVIGNSVTVYSHALKTHPALGIGLQSICQGCLVEWINAL